MPPEPGWGAPAGDTEFRGFPSAVGFGVIVGLSARLAWLAVT